MDIDLLKKLSHEAKLREEKIKENNRLEEKRREEEKLQSFAEAIGTVVPIKSSNRREVERDKSPILPKRLPVERNLDNDVFISSETLNDTTPPSQYTCGGGGKNDLRKLLSADSDDFVATLDLHGYSQEEAQTVLNEFVEFVQKRGTMGEIIHGSGLGSRGFSGVLKNLVRRWLIACPEVLAYTEAHNNDGTVLVLFKNKRRRQNE